MSLNTPNGHPKRKVGTTPGASATESGAAATPSAPPTRDQLIVEHFGMVRAIAGRLAQRLPSHVDVEELVGVGILGLMDAVERFDASRGVPFRAYAELRVRGAMMDSVRDADWTPRAVRRAGARIELARATLRKRLRRDPLREELAAELGITPRQFDKLSASSEVRRVVSLDGPANSDDDTPLAERVAGGGESVLDRWLDAERDAGLANAIASLPNREREVIVAYYDQGLSLRQIGALLGVTESRVCQLHGQAIKRLRAAASGGSDD